MFERGRWGRCGGPVDPGELCLDNIAHIALRESLCVEEIQVNLDLVFKPLHAGDVQQPGTVPECVHQRSLHVVHRKDPDNP